MSVCAHPDHTPARDIFPVFSYDECCGRSLCQACGGANDCQPQDGYCAVEGICDDCTDAGSPLMYCEQGSKLEDGCKMDGTVYTFCKDHAYQACPKCPKICFVCKADYTCPHQEYDSDDQLVSRVMFEPFIDSEGCARRYIESS
jgi:hypothetical protein